MHSKTRNEVLLICMVLLVILSMCSCKPGPSELFGTYIADYDVAKEKLTLYHDGTFRQEVTLKATSEVTVSKGTWTYDPKSGYVSFNENFMVVLNGFGKFDPNYAHPEPGVSYPVDKYFGCISLGVAEGILYKKVD
ncbi:MAG TPA: hypothetical protein VMT04_09165 [Terriglobales bacterium]|nr:hypothetical protein [Terriglobales bacterium]